MSDAPCWLLWLLLALNAMWAAGVIVCAYLTLEPRIPPEAASNTMPERTS